MAEPILRLSGVKKAYGGDGGVDTPVLHGIDLTVARGEFVALVGPSGSGKSTLLHILGLLERASAGRVTIADTDTTTLAEAELTRLRARCIGFVFQFHYLLPAFSALENVMMPRIVESGRMTADLQPRAVKLLQRVGLGERLHHKPAQLSGGQQQRVAIARALGNSPSLILADEPTGNLDTHTGEGVFNVMREFNRDHGTTFLIVTHDPRMAARCDRVVEILDGRIVRDEPTNR
jgi:lipoprotein-releasing system ATP-binding protein